MKKIGEVGNWVPKVHKGYSKRHDLSNSFVGIALPGQDLDQWIAKTGLNPFEGHCGNCGATRFVDMPCYRGKQVGLMCGPCPECGDSSNQPFSYRLPYGCLDLPMPSTKPFSSKKKRRLKVVKDEP